MDNRSYHIQNIAANIMSISFQISEESVVWSDVMC